MEWTRRYNNYEQDYGQDNKYNSYEPDYGMNSYDKKPYGKDSNSYDKSKDNSVTIKKIKCNNLNANLNGFNGNEIGTLPTALRGLASDEAQVSAMKVKEAPVEAMVVDHQALTATLDLYV